MIHNSNGYQNLSHHWSWDQKHLPFYLPRILLGNRSMVPAPNVCSRDSERAGLPDMWAVDLGLNVLRSGRREQIGGWVRTQGGIFRCDRRRTGLGWGEQEARTSSPWWCKKERKARREEGMTEESDSSSSMLCPANSGEQKTNGKRCSEHQQGGYTLLLSPRGSHGGQREKKTNGSFGVG